MWFLMSNSMLMLIFSAFQLFISFSTKLTTKEFLDDIEVPIGAESFDYFSSTPSLINFKHDLSPEAKTKLVKCV